MKKAINLTLLALFIISLQPCLGQKDEKEKIKKANVLPTHLDYSGLPEDVEVALAVREAFSRRKVNLITAIEFEKASSDEVNRIITKFRASGAEFSSNREIMDAAAREQRYVANKLTIQFRTETKGDTVKVIGATWESTASPPALRGGTRTSGKVEIELTDLCCSIKDNIYAIIDKILFSKKME